MDNEVEAKMRAVFGRRPDLQRFVIQDRAEGSRPGACPCGMPGPHGRERVLDARRLGLCEAGPDLSQEGGAQGPTAPSPLKQLSPGGARPGLG